MNVSRRRDASAVPLVVADRQDRARRGLVALLETWPDVRVLGQCDRAEDVVRIAAESASAVVLLDLSACDGDPAVAVRSLRRRIPECGIVLTTLHPEFVAEAEQCGADAVVLKDRTVDRFLEHLRAAVDAQRRDVETTRTPSGHDAATSPRLKQET
jgi:DNA-binding NarL/FixJ family response regulator